MTDDEVKLSDLGDLIRLDEGGQGIVYRVGNRPGILVKKYLGPINGAELRNLVRRPSMMDEKRRELVLASSAWPLQIVVDNGNCVGMTMREAPGDFRSRIGTRDKHLELQFLAFRPKGRWANLILPDHVQRIALLRLYLLYAQALHRSDVILGDISLKNFFWSIRREPKIFALDCDSYLVNGRPPIMPPVETPDWQDPQLATGQPPTMDSDRYKLALMVLRVLLQQPQATPETVKANTDDHRTLGTAITALTERMTRQTARPRIEEWLRALSGRPTIALPRKPGPRTNNRTKPRPVNRPRIQLRHRRDDTT